MKLRRLRDGDVLENGDIALVRGGDLDPDILNAGAMIRTCGWPSAGERDEAHLPEEDLVVTEL